MKGGGHISFGDSYYYFARAVNPKICNPKRKSQKLATPSCPRLAPVVAACCGLVLVVVSERVSCDAASLPFGIVSEPRRRLDPIPAGGSGGFGCGKCIYRVSAEFLELCQTSDP